MAERKKILQQGRSIFTNMRFAYSAIAPTGQVPAHAPHSTHLDASMQRLLSFSQIAVTGQADSHAPQLMQTSGFTL